MMDFQNTKCWFIKNITGLITIGNDINAMRTRIDTSNRTLKRVFTASINEDFDENFTCLNAILGIIGRNNMKCVLFGKTSNGKSAAINALLGEKILPSSMGRTTACFVSVRGCDEDEGYLKIDNNNNNNNNNNKNNQKQNLNLLNDLANQLINKCDINSMLKVYWPKSKCRLLENDLEILDSPGIDYKGEHDDWITRYCGDADVFILVINGCGTLEASDKLFFKRITERISKPNILVIVNKWDMVEQDVNVEKIKKQFVNDISKFLCDELKLYDINSVSNRIYFVSSEKELNNKGTESFREFKKKMEMEMSDNAVNTKFKPHVDNIIRIAYQISELADKFLVSCKTRVNNPEEVWNVIEEYILSNFDKILKETKILIDSNQIYLAHQIEKAVSENRSFGDDTINFLENHFIQQLSFIFSNNFQNMETRIIDEFVKRSCTDVNADEMKMYFSGDNDLSCLHERYKENLIINVHNSTSDIKNIYKGKEDDIAKLRCVVDKMRSTSKTILSTIAMVVPAPLPIKVALFFSPLLPDLIPNPSTKDVENTILFEFTSFYNSMTSHFINQFKTEATEKIFRSYTEYLEHQTKLLEYFEYFEDIRAKIIVQINDVTNEDQLF